MNLEMHKLLKIRSGILRFMGRIAVWHLAQPSSGRSRCSPGGSSAYASKCSGRSGVGMTCSPPNHLPRSSSLQRCEQNGPYPLANQSPRRRQVGQVTSRGRLMRERKVERRRCAALRGRLGGRSALPNSECAFQLPGLDGAVRSRRAATMRPELILLALRWRSKRVASQGKR